MNFEFNQALEWIDRLPPLALVALFSLIAGYVIRRTDMIANRRIPAVLMLFGAIAYPLMKYGLTPFVLKGAIIGAGVWLFHKLILSKLEDKFPILRKILAGENGGDDTTFVSKPKDTTPQPQPQPVDPSKP